MLERAFLQSLTIQEIINLTELFKGVKAILMKFSWFTNEFDFHLFYFDEKEEANIIN